MADRIWTAPQHDAINAVGGPVLVSAAAGSGKTAVLVERAIKLICDGENPLAADKLLVMTFSNAAAAEMKQRIHSSLAELVANEPNNLHLQRQQALLGAAQISTVHSFCIGLLRQYFEDLDIPPDFILAGEEEMELAERESADECIELLYQQDTDGSFARLVELLSTGRDDKRVVDTIIKMYKFCRSHPFYERWLREKQGMYDTNLHPSQTPWGKVILSYAKDCLSFCKSSLEEAIEIILKDEALAKGYLSVFTRDLMQVDQCIDSIEGCDWNEIVCDLSEFAPARLGSVKGETPQKERVKDIRDGVKAIMKELSQKILNSTTAEFWSDIEVLRPQVAILFDAVLLFDSIVWSKKMQKKRLDFSDLEHLTLKILVAYDEETKLKHPTERAKEISKRFEIVMVDEYQDTNEVQDLIFKSISSGEQNLFMVGDVKQSIYSFRQAMPEIFLSKRQASVAYDGINYPAKINLDTNFRSRKEVTNGINFLFKMLMSSEIGAVEYNSDESLKCGAAYPQATNLSPEFILIDTQSGNSGDDPKLREARVVAEKIGSMLREGHLVTDGEITRPIVPSDICILLRSHKNKAKNYLKALEEISIPSIADTSSGFLNQREVIAVVSFLLCLDNPLLDVELAAAMLSPIGGFDVQSLAEVRLSERNVPLFNALLSCAKAGQRQAVEFLEVFTTLRYCAAILPADRLILKLYDITSATAIFRAMPQGETRVANLRLLLEYAADYHKLGYKKLDGFVGFIARLREYGRDLKPAAAVGGSGSGGVKVISIHRSKGLEFPVVFLCDGAKQFNKTDLRSATLLHSTLGFASVRRDYETLSQFTTVPLEAIKLEMERSLLSEEMRVLYVALTRAKEKLIITATCNKSPHKLISSLYTNTKDEKLPHHSVREGISYRDWILSALLHHPKAQSLREFVGQETQAPVESDSDWKFSFVSQNQASQIDIAAEEIPLIKTKYSPAILKQIEDRAGFVYPFLSQTQIPAKLGVSQVVSQSGEQSSYRFARRPSFLRESLTLTGAEKGNALHKFMQFADYNKAKTNLSGEIARLLQNRFLSQAEVESLAKKDIAKFFGSDLYRRISNADKVMRELRFAAECSKEMIGDFVAGLSEQDRVVLQGVADCVFFEGDKAVIVDYKTDFVQSDNQLVERYSTQLELYRRILSKSLDKEVAECIIYSFGLGREIAVNNNK